MLTRADLIVAGAVLFGTSLALLACVAAVAWWLRRRERPRGRRARAAQTAAARRAAAVIEQATAAAAAEEQARQRAEAAEQELSAAFDQLTRVQQQHDRADGDYQRAAQQRAQRSGDGAGQRELEHAAFDAYRRGDLTQEQLWQVWRLGSGWDQEIEQREHALLRLRTARREAQLRYRAAANRARAAARELEVAEERARALIEEAAEAGRDEDVTA